MQLKQKETRLMSKYIPVKYFNIFLKKKKKENILEINKLPFAKDTEYPKYADFVTNQCRRCKWSPGLSPRSDR